MWLVVFFSKAHLTLRRWLFIRCRSNNGQVKTMSKIEDSDTSVPNPNEFEIGDGDVEPDIEFRSAFSETLAQNGFPDTLVLARERADDVFHGRRLEIVDYLQDNDPESVRALADALEYDKGVVSRDLQRLASIGVVEYTDNGRAKTPQLAHTHIVVEPVV